MSQPQRLLAFFVLLGVVAVALRAVSRRAQVPYPVVLAAGGVLLGLVPGGSLPIVGSDLILLAFVPGLVFQAAFTLDLRALRSVAPSVTILATVGVGVGVIGFGAAVHLLAGLPWTDAFVLGAILTPTDPVAVVRLLRSLRAPARVAALLEGESLLNDGTGVALFAALVASAASGAPSGADVAIRFLGSTGIGMGVGTACGALALLALRSTDEAPLEFLATLTVAYGAYLCADVLHGSGIVSVVSAALVLVVFRTRLRLHSNQLLEFWELASFVLNAILFLLIGAALPTQAVLGAATPVLIGAASLVIVRALIVLPVLTIGPRRRRRFGWPVRGFVVWAGLRGALSVALAISVRSTAGVGSPVATIAYGVVVLTLLLQGSTVRPLARLVGIKASDARAET